MMIATRAHLIKYYIFLLAVALSACSSAEVELLEESEDVLAPTDEGLYALDDVYEPDIFMLSGTIEPQKVDTGILKQKLLADYTFAGERVPG